MNVNKSPRRYLFFGGHPDDGDEMMGGTAIKLINAGHIVKFVSVCNGDCGHYSMTPEGLAKRRLAEVENARVIAGLCEYQIMDNHDCRIFPDQKNRDDIVRIIRHFQPDVIISHRIYDYHADHRATAQLVRDAGYLLKVPLYCPDVPIPEKNPVFAYSYDRFDESRKFRIDAAVEIDSVLEKKKEMLNCHESQYFEWLPWDRGQRNFNIDMSDRKIRMAHLETFIQSMHCPVELARKILLEEYGPVKGAEVCHCEVFELSDYGRSVSIQEFRELLGAF